MYIINKTFQRRSWMLLLHIEEKICRLSLRCRLRESTEGISSPIPSPIPYKAFHLSYRPECDHRGSEQINVHVCHFSLLPIGKKTEGFHPIKRLQSPLGRQLLFCCYIAATGLPLMPSSLAVSFGLNLFYLLSYYCFASTNQPEGNSFKNKNVPNKLSTVPSKK